MAEDATATIVPCPVLTPDHRSAAPSVTAGPRMLALSPTGIEGGAQVVLERVLTTALDRQWQVRALCPKGPVLDRLRRLGIQTTVIPELQLPAGPRPLATATLGARFVRAARLLAQANRGVDIILANGIMALPPVRLARPSPPVVSFMHMIVSRPDRARLLRLCSPSVTLAIAVSEAVKVPLCQAGLAACVVRNGTPWPVAPALSPLDGPPVLGCTAALTPGKGQHVLLEAVAKLGRPDVIVELVGAPLPKDGAYETSLRARAAQPDLTGRVRFLGRLADPLEQMRTWTLAVSPSIEPEAAPLNVLEAMSLGLPVIGTDCGGTPEMLGAGGFLVPPGDPDALARALQRLLGDPPLLTRAGQAGRRAVATGFQARAQLEAVVDRLEEMALSAPTQQRSLRSRPGRACLRAPARSRLEPATATSVMIVVADFDPVVGGTSTQARNHALGLRGEGRPVLILTRRGQPDWPSKEVMEEIPVRRIPPRGYGPTSERLSVATMGAWLAAHRRRVGVVQVVMNPDYVLSSAVAGLSSRTVMTWAAQGDAARYLRAGPGPAARLRLALRRSALARCRHVALSPAIATELQEAGLGPAGIDVIPVPLDLGRFRPPSTTERATARAFLGLDEEELCIAYSGHLRQLKRVDRLIEAFAGLRATGRAGRLVLMGGDRGLSDDSGPALRAQVREAGLADLVLFAGMVCDVERYLWAADAFVLPSSVEGMSNSLVEAMACGLACVAAAEAGGDQLLADGAGIVPASNEPGDLLSALVSLHDDPGLRQELGRAAASRAAEMSIERVAQRYEQLYRELGTRPVAAALA